MHDHAYNVIVVLCKRVCLKVVMFIIPMLQPRLLFLLLLYCSFSTVN